MHVTCTWDVVKTYVCVCVCVQDMAVASVGDVQFMPDYNFWRRRSYWLRY